MVTLVEHIDISAPFERLLDWADNFEEEFVRWSPLHIACQLFDKGIKKGDRVRFHEIVMGMEYDVSGTIAQSEFPVEIQIKVENIFSFSITRSKSVV